MTRDYTQFIHRVRADREDEGFFVLGDMWADLNPDWRVVNWSLEQLDEEFTDLRALAATHSGDHTALGLLYGIALIEKWGGIYVAPDDEPKTPLEHFSKDRWRTEEGFYPGAEEPGEDFWHTLVHKMTEGGLNPVQIITDVKNYLTASAVHES